MVSSAPIAGANVQLQQFGRQLHMLPPPIEGAGFEAGNHGFDVFTWDGCDYEWFSGSLWKRNFLLGMVKNAGIKGIPFSSGHAICKACGRPDSNREGENPPESRSGAFANFATTA